MTNENTTPAYEAPRVTDHGDLVELTAATTTGALADQPIPADQSILNSLTSTPV